MVRTTAGFHCHHAWRHYRGQVDNALTVHPPTQDNSSLGVQTDNAADGVDGPDGISVPECGS